MLEQASGNGVTASWITGDCVYGSDGVLRRWLTRRRQPFVLEVRSTERVWVIDGDRRWQGTMAAVTADLSQTAWQRVSAGDGAKGPRWYDWAWVRVAGLIVRRHLRDPTDLAWYLVGGPPETTLAQAVWVAGRRWTIESCLEEAKREDQLVGPALKLAATAANVEQAHLHAGVAFGMRLVYLLDDLERQYDVRYVGCLTVPDQLDLTLVLEQQ